MNPDCPFAITVIKKLQSIGRAQACLKNLWELEIFGKLSKHDETWHSEDEATEDRLWDLRSAFMKIQCELDNLSVILMDGE